MLLYLHGFTSGPQSVKARALGERMAARGLADEFVCPQLPASPKDAIALAEALIRSRQKVGADDTAAVRPGQEKVTLVGSSLGGFYATVLAEKYALDAVLINPAVIGQLPMEDFIGMHQWLYTGEPFEFTAQHVDELRAMVRPSLQKPSRFWLLLEEGDETLDYRQAVAYYAGARQTVLAKGDHSFTRWPDYLDEIIDRHLAR
jgi:predicted esterase YcpF (UPF0227 family)